MINPIETALIQTIAETLETAPTIARPDGGTIKSLGEGPATIEDSQRGPGHGQSGDEARDVSLHPSLGIVTLHNAQRGALETVLSDDITGKP